MTTTDRPFPELQTRFHDAPSQLLSWHCRDCGKLGSFMAPLPATNLGAILAAQTDHERRAPDCRGFARLQSHVIDGRGRA